jgi:ElaB/YqjD/DUF883 family membrane-anchored ribosome-binding protein
MILGPFFVYLRALYIFFNWNRQQTNNLNLKNVSVQLKKQQVCAFIGLAGNGASHCLSISRRNSSERSETNPARKVLRRGTEAFLKLAQLAIWQATSYVQLRPYTETCSNSLHSETNPAKKVLRRGTEAFLKLAQLAIWQATSYVQLRPYTETCSNLMHSGTNPGRKVLRRGTEAFLKLTQLTIRQVTYHVDLPG